MLVLRLLVLYRRPPPPAQKLAATRCCSHPSLRDICDVSARKRLPQQSAMYESACEPFGDMAVVTYLQSSWRRTRIISGILQPLWCLMLPSALQLPSSFQANPSLSLSPTLLAATWTSAHACCRQQ